MSMPFTVATDGATRRVFSGAPWEQTVGYCRAIRRGPFIMVAGTTPVGDDGKVIAPGQPYEQAVKVFSIVAKALSELGATVSDVVRTRLFVTDMSHWEAFGRAHRECFGAHPPAATMVGVAQLLDPAMLIEAEVEAVVGQWRSEDS